MVLVRCVPWSGPKRHAGLRHFHRLETLILHHKEEPILRLVYPLVVHPFERARKDYVRKALHHFLSLGWIALRWSWSVKRWGCWPTRVRLHQDSACGHPGTIFRVSRQKDILGCRNFETWDHVRSNKLLRFARGSIWSLRDEEWRAFCDEWTCCEEYGLSGVNQGGYQVPQPRLNHRSAAHWKTS